MLARLFDIDTVILTKRTVVRRFREGEGKTFYDLTRGNHLWLEEDFLQLLQNTESQELSEMFIRQTIADWLLQKEYNFGIWEEENAKLIGFVRFFNIHWSVPKGELSYFIDKDFTGKGIMTEVLTYLLQFAFKQLEMEKLYIRTSAENYPSQRLARRCGFRREGDLRSEFKKQSGEIIDVMLYGLTREEYVRV
ncbi:MAG: GNAT family N-acetyltransferase [Bacteroidetes bacterium]|nr:GNAT family N-acetyltransferase [Bacteroidota bacterium]